MFLGRVLAFLQDDLRCFSKSGGINGCYKFEFSKNNSRVSFCAILFDSYSIPPSIGSSVHPKMTFLLYLVFSHP